MTAAADKTRAGLGRAGERIARAAPFVLSLAVSVWLLGASVNASLLAPTALLPLIAAITMAGLAFALLFLRGRRSQACLTALYLVALAVLARDNTAGPGVSSAFSPSVISVHALDYSAARWAWSLILGAAPLLFAWNHTEDDRAPRRRRFRLLTTTILFACGAALQMACAVGAASGAVGAASGALGAASGALATSALDALSAPIASPWHRLLLFSSPVLAAQQIGAVWLLARHYRRWGEARNRALVWFHVMAAAFVAASLGNDLIRGLPTYAFANLLGYLVPLTLVYGVERYALFGLHVRIRRVVQYALARQTLTVMTIAPLVALAFVIGLSLRASAGPHGTGTNFAFRSTSLFDATLLCGTLFGAFALMLGLRLPLLRWFDRTYFREVYDAQNTLARASRAMLGVSDLPEIARMTLAAIDETLHPVNAMLLAQTAGGVTCLAQRNYSGYRPPLWPAPELLATEAVQELPRRESRGERALSDWQRALPPAARALLDEAQIRLLVPLRDQDKTGAVLLLGEKASGLDYMPEDLDVLRALASQVALALHTARLNHEFLQRSTRELTDGSVGFIEMVERERRLLAADLHDQTLPELRCLLTDLQSLAARAPLAAAPSDGSKPEPPSESETALSAWLAKSEAALTASPAASEIASSVAPNAASEIASSVAPNAASDAEAGMTPDEMAAHLRDTIQNIRDIMESLRPSALEMLGLLPAMEGELRKSASRARPPLVPQFLAPADAPPPALSAFAEMSVFRIVQEAVNNACRHAQARTLRVRITTEDGQWIVRVEDDGAGLPPNPKRPGGRGLDNMQYRASLIGASLRWRETEWGRGTGVELRLPLAAPEPSSETDGAGTELS